MGLNELKADAQLAIERIVKLPPGELELKAELTDNVYPLLIGIVEAIQEGVEAEVADLADAVDEIMDQTGDVLHPETSARILAVVEVGKLLATELEQLIKAGKVDDVGKKRIRAQIQAYLQGAKVVGDMIAEITLVDDGDEGDEAEPGQPQGAPDSDDLDDDDDDDDGTIEGEG